MATRLSVTQPESVRSSTPFKELAAFDVQSVAKMRLEPDAGRAFLALREQLGPSPETRRTRLPGA